ncbi:hypothetical protein [Puia sp.]|jgi:hypothetical protein|uniref:hypothetical protein n=1 Tax=Puia sp. TaxID=2045100 RepID=UPI002F3F3BFD
MKPKCQYLLLLLAGLFSLSASAQLTFNKIDTTMKIGKAGYHVTCRNKSVTDNAIAIRPIGMESDVHPLDFPLKGRVYAAQVDDLNSDSYPDLILFIYTDSNSIHGTVMCLLSEANKSLAPCYLPDISYDPKVNKGYKGHDKFTLLEGNLLQRFPLYNPEDKDTPTGGTRTLMYQVARGEGGQFKFNRIRFYDTK